MKYIIIKQLDPTGVIINEVKIEVDPSSKLEGRMCKSIFYISTDTDKLLGKFKIYGDESGEITDIEMSEFPFIKINTRRQEKI